jgi:hypothetical protein
MPLRAWTSVNGVGPDSHLNDGGWVGCLLGRLRGRQGNPRLESRQVVLTHDERRIQNHFFVALKASEAYRDAEVKASKEAQEEVQKTGKSIIHYKVVCDDPDVLRILWTTKRSIENSSSNHSGKKVSPSS